MGNKAAIARTAAFFLAIMIFFCCALSRLHAGHHAQGRMILEQAVRQAAVACYASEGFYPPDAAYLQEHYGLQWDEEKYVIFYESFSSNLMPDITVVEKKYEK